MQPAQLIGILGLVAVVACWALSIVLFRVGAPASVARKLGFLLVVEGIVLATADFPEFASGLGESFWISYYDSHPRIYSALAVLHHVGDAAMIALYPHFLALALNTTLTRPFRNTRVRFSLACGALVLGLVVGLRPSPVTVTLLYASVTLLFIYALVASLHAWSTARRGIDRKRAGIFSLAFGFRDIGWGLSYAIFAWWMWTQPEAEIMTPATWLAKIVYAGGTLLAVPLVAYGILRTQLFDIDLRIRWTIKQSTLAAIFMTLIFLISEGANRFLSAELGNYAGLLAAGVVVFFLSPLQRFAESVASAAMPRTENTPEYAAYRKMQVYEAAVSEAVPDGKISQRERALLNRLRDSLGISEADAAALERDLLNRQSEAT